MVNAENIIRTQHFYFWGTNKRSCTYFKETLSVRRFQAYYNLKTFYFIYKVLDISFGMSCIELSFNILSHKLF